MRLGTFRLTGDGEPEVIRDITTASLFRARVKPARAEFRDDEDPPGAAKWSC
jgi:hypothetical protein